MMALPFLLYTIWCALRCNFVAANALDSSVRVYAAPGVSESSVIRDVKREFAIAGVMKRDYEYKNSTTFDRSWNGAVLLQL